MKKFILNALLIFLGYGSFAQITLGAYADADSVCLGDQIQFSDTSSSTNPPGITSWEWNFGDGNTAIIQNPTHSYSNAGTYNVFVKLMDDSAAIDTAYMIVVVTPLPFVDAGVGASVCPDAPVGLSGTVDNATGGIWSTSGDGSFDNPNSLFAIYTPGASDGAGGDVTLTLTSTGNGFCAAQMGSVIITVNAVPQITLNTTNVLCFGGNDGTVNASVTGSNPFTYTWSNGPTTSGISNLAPGTYQVDVTDINGCAASQSTNVTEPSEIITSVVGQNLNCFGDNSGSVDLTVSGGTAPYTFNWPQEAASTEDIAGEIGRAHV